MKKQTFFTTLLLFLLFFNAAILLTASVMFRNSLRMSKERGLAEHYVIASALLKDLQALASREADVEGSIDGLMGAYPYFSQKGKMGLAVYHGEKKIFSNLQGETPFSIDPEAFLLENRVVSIGGEEPLLSIAGRLPEPFQAYCLLYQYDFGETLSSWRQMKNSLYLFGGGVSVLLAFCLLLLLERIFRPLGQISKASQAIAGGNYENRLPLSGHHELADMARSFNHMAEEIQRQMAALREAAEQKQRFIDNFAHELRTPLTTIYGYAEYLQKTAATEEDRLFATGYILDECKRMQQISHRLLDLALLRGGDISMEPLSVSELFSLAHTAIEGKAAEKGLELTYRNELEVVNGNRELLQMLLVNLIDNAMKACDMKGRILVGARMEKEGKVLFVRDNGKGMSREQLAHVTEAFYRVDKARNRKDGGAGLGLSLCEEIARVHGASLRFSSRPGMGTTVKVIFTTPS